MKKAILPLCMLLLASFLQVNSAIRLPALIGNIMILQQNAEINVWGWADAGETVTIQASWSQTTFSALTAADGRWKTTLKTPAAGGP